MYSQKWNYYFQNRIIMFCLPVPSLIYLWEIYTFSRLVCLFCCRKICGPILGIYKSLTDTWMWKLGLRPRNSRKGIHKWDFPCSVEYSITNWPGQWASISMNANSFRYFGRKLLRNSLVFSFDNFSINYKKELHLTWTPAWWSSPSCWGGSRWTPAWRRCRSGCGHTCRCPWSCRTARGTVPVRSRCRPFIAL